MKRSIGILLGLAGCAVGATAQSIVIKPRQVISETVAILSADLAALGVEIPLCNGTVDLLPITFSFPVVEMPMPEDFRVTIGTVERESRETVTPSCATIQPAGEPNERRTVLLGGDFTPSDDFGPIAVSVVGNLSLDVNGEVESATGSSIRSRAGGFFSFRSGPRVIDFELIDVPTDAGDTDDPFSAASDPNGCAAAFPDATYTLRLIFTAGVRQLTNGTLEPLGVNGTAEAANEFFTLSGFALADGADGEPEIVRDELLGIADVDPDNVVDLCVRSATPVAEGRQTLLRVNCGGLRSVLPFSGDHVPESGDGVVFDPAGDPCRRQSVLLASVAGEPVSFTFASDGATARTSQSGEGVTSSATSRAESEDASSASTASSTTGDEGRARTSSAASAVVL